MQQASILSFFQKGKPPRQEETRTGQPHRPRDFNSRGKGNSSGRQQGQHRGPNRRRNDDLEKVADETKAALPNILSQLPGLDAMDSSIHALDDLAALDVKDCPGFDLPDSDAEVGKRGTRIRVFDMDTFDAAINVAPNYKASDHQELFQSRPSSADSQSQEEDYIISDRSPRSSIIMPVAVLNLASERSAGGGFHKGALAQEEALCYRSSLYLSLHKSYYPLPSLSAIYSPSILVIRDAMSRGHSLLTSTQRPADLPVTSVISVAALRRPTLTDDGKNYRKEGQRAEMKRKIRLTLRVAAMKGHTKLVLGALGCGVFGNPPGEVANCFLEVLREKEFQGGWWEDVVFAILDNVKGDQGGKNGMGNYGEFYRVLDDQLV
ncbi:hypothetical protein BDU57DRAFT_508835 [Ampelomyces quisqualis]|uniref:Microbial-type PARG catalytic domain-containing protein n=1 Tax=Ampelomyces quisqualis TaxID=50730 RepID=A0A6A5QXI2_AMPQU|nr:hypothetical protein BDU57DRAFT_508835 [Ampelomyces quisqualis]